MMISVAAIFVSLHMLLFGEGFIILIKARNMVSAFYGYVTCLFSVGGFAFNIIEMYAQGRF